MQAIAVPLLTVGLLSVSTFFMIFAWYGRLTFPSAPLAAVILINGENRIWM
jgi:uncharacterized protein (DUF486 family)